VRTPEGGTGLALFACLAALFATACSDDDSPPQAASPDPVAPEAAPPPARDSPPSRPTPRLEPARCPPDLANCSTASGRIVYVERVDPDGDGDAHFVLDSRQSITLPGLSVIDVRKDLRPDPLPEVGDRISAAGPVYRGSYGQKQIEAIEVNVAP
jgi:hypothetical protein